MLKSLLRNNGAFLTLSRLVIITLALVAASLDISIAVEAEQIRFMTHSVGDQTYIDEEGQLRGRQQGGRRAFYVELFRAMSQVAGEDEPLEILPFKRAMLLVQTEPGRALFNVNRTSEREDQMKWVGPLLHSVTYLYENIEAPTGVKTVEEAKNVESICVLRGNVHHRYLGKMGFSNVYPANSYASCINMLVLKRVSLTPLSNLSSLVIKPEDPNAKALRNTGIQLMESEGYIAFSLQTPDSIIRKWQSALDQVKASGRYDELVRIYLGED